jgi:hypothetical protein
MRRDQIDDVLSTLDDVFRQLGVRGGFAEAAAEARSATADMTTPAARIGMILAEHLFRQMTGDALSALDWRQVGTREDLERLLTIAPDLTPDDFRALDELKALPIRVRGSLTDVARQVQPKGGHPMAVPRAEYAAICDEIASLHRSGLTIGEATRKLASKWGCSQSKINQIWASRASQ